MYYKEGNDVAIELLSASRCAFHNHMHLDRSNIASKNYCENANALTWRDHLVVLARLRRRWSLSSREGLGSSLPPAELARRDSGVFEELKRLFFTTSEVRKRNGGKRRSQRWPDAEPDAVFAWPDASGQCSVSARISVWWSDAQHVRSLTIGRVQSFRELTGL
jgi:hypothetical protein